MLRKHLAPLVVLVAAGVAMLSACGSDEVAPAAQPPAAQATTQAPAAGEGAGTDLSLLSGTAKSNNSPAGTGDWAVPNGGTATGAKLAASQKWVQLTASKAGALDPVVVNGAGLTLYRFDKDTAKPSKSNCVGDCAVTWPPVTVAPGGKIFIAGIKKSAIGTVKRADGTRQVTIGGWPVYRFAKDTKRGDTLGQGVGGTWFGVTPTGGKAGVPADPSAGAGNDQDAGSPSATPATSAVLFDDASFSDSGASQGVGGRGCQNLSRPRITSSLAASGSLKIWSEPNCKGRSLVVNGDVANLAKVNFDNAIASVFLG
ncbi:hypothetical protein ACI2K4_01785 [Micromonospora sp. NPDC050397]|uniref:hypothetical protein n=1 Tax=Micromonospora sp. NPDC050397 TaxID=3364279 RepID=UPI00384B0E91